jgi:hypothetical protein
MTAERPEEQINEVNPPLRASLPAVSIAIIGIMITTIISAVLMIMITRY